MAEIGPIITVVSIQTTLILAFVGFMWHRLEKQFDNVNKRFDRLETKIDVLFEKFAEIDKRVTILEHTK